jgi:type IV pilus assembly protein PilN
MRIQINLATRPFVELRPFFARLRIIMAVLAVLAVALLITLHTQRKKLREADAQMDALRHRTIKAQEEKLGNEARMRQPANAGVLDRAHFLNALFLRKSFSWTAVMMDLETVLPTGVQVTAIEPQITAEGDVIIRLRVSGDRDRAIQLVRNLERSARFLAPRLSNEVLHTKEQTAAAAQSGAVAGGVEFDILSNYNPLPAGEPFPKAKPVKSESAAAPSATPRVRPAAVRPGPHDGVVLKPYAAPARPAAKTGGAR